MLLDDREDLATLFNDIVEVLIIPAETPKRVMNGTPI